VSDLVLHAGGWSATEADAVAVAVPERTSTYTPIPHGRVLEQLRKVLPMHGMKLERLQLGLANNGSRLFGVADVVNGTGRPDWGIAIGIRNSYDKSMALNMCAGSRVFVCDNLAFHGEVMLRRRHVGMVDHELPGMVNELVNGVAIFKGEMIAQIDTFKRTEINDVRAHDVVCRALRAGVLPAQAIPGVLDQWDAPKHDDFTPRTAWSLFNAFTEVSKNRSAGLQITSTLSLNALFNREFARN
jgi:hypothetical protein